jgi:anti-sigma B factor antagonist
LYHEISLFLTDVQTISNAFITDNKSYPEPKRPPQPLLSFFPAQTALTAYAKPRTPAPADKEVKMLITRTVRNDLTILHVCLQRLDGSNANSVRLEAADYVAEAPDRVVLDLSDVNFVDSSGLGSLVALHKTMRDGRKLEIAGAANSVLSLFKLTRMDRVFVMHPSIEQVN